ncbi:uncharacterized protein LOC134820361 isoform X3 [Bolinopsis microptera]|uniref:uncharacterized protein LOC134820361 isoform X3 n=1 Tax=Bolinopsis microptera TaxID=2820187 RepID=UPI0030798168
MALLHIFIFGLCFVLSLTENPTCLLDDPTGTCSDFTTTNDPIVTTADSCAAPLNSNRKITIKPCGREGISYDDCYQAGCCYQNSKCHLPLTEERVDYLFFKEKMRHREAYRACRKSGWYKLPCIVDDFHFNRARSRSCGNIWLGGSYADSEFATQVPLYKEKSEDCSSKIGVSCKLYPQGYALALEFSTNNSFFLSIADNSETRPVLCIKEEWRPHIRTYPDNVSSEKNSNVMLCGLIFSGDVTAQKLYVKWNLFHPNGTKTRLKVKKYVTQLSAQYYGDSIRAEAPGKYVCSFTFLDNERESAERTAWAYHYTDLSCDLSVDGEIYSDENVLEIQNEYNNDIVISLICSGYPLPDITWTIDVVSGQDSEPEPTDERRGESLTITKFAAKEPQFEDVTYTIGIKSKSDITTLPDRTIRITKLPIPTECSVSLVKGVEEEIFHIPQRSVQRPVDVGGSCYVAFQCFGYPKPNVTVIKTTKTGNHTEEQNLTQDIRDLIFESFIDNFAAEVPRSEDYSTSLTMSVTPPEQESYSFTLEISKTKVPTSCSFQLIENGTVLEDHSALKIRDFHQVNISSFADQNFELDVNCTGFPAPELTAAILTKKEDSDPSEQTLAPSMEHLSWRLNSFASEASVAQDYTLTLNLTTQSGDHPPVNMLLTLVKTIIMFDMDIPPAVMKIEAAEASVSDEGDLQAAVGKVTLPCKGASGPSFPNPVAFWELNDERLNLDTEMGQHIRYKHPDKSDIDSTIVITTKSSIIAGAYRCVILIDNKFTDNYTTELLVDLPPIPPSPTLIIDIEGTDRVQAASSLQPSYPYLGDVSFIGVLYSGDTILDESNETTIYEDQIHATFTVPSGSGKIQIGFRASNEYGDSAISQKSHELEILPDTPRSSVTKIERDEQKAGNASSTLSLKFNEIPGVDEYEVRLFSADGTLQKVIKDITENGITVNELKPGTGYFIEVRGVNIVDGNRVYGPNSLASSFTTAPHELPAPSNLQGTPLESDGNKSAVLLTWDTAKVSSEFVDYYLMNIKRAGEDQSKDTDNLTRKKRQALQTYQAVRIPFGARAKVIKNLDGGTRYEFILQSYSSDFGESEPAKVTVQTLTAGPCPYTKPELYPPRNCPPRVSLDRNYLYLKFYFDCYSGRGLDFIGKHSSTQKGECAAWTEENLKQFDSKNLNLPEIGTNYCRNIKNSMKDSRTHHDKPWCYLPDGSNETCSVRPCQNKVSETCYQDEGHSFRGLGYSEKCAPWREEILEQHLISQFPEQILGSSACRNWEGSNMTRPWCLTTDGAKSECPVPPCGSGLVRFESGESTTYYSVSERKDYACIPLQNDRVSVGVKHTFGAEDCQSDEIYPEIIIPAEITTSDRLWVRYLLVEIVIVLIVMLVIGALKLRLRFLPEPEQKARVYLRGFERVELAVTINTDATRCKSVVISTVSQAYYSKTDFSDEW